VPPRAGNVSLDSSRLAAVLGYEPFSAWPFGDALVPTDIEWHYQRGRERGSAEWLRSVLYENPLRRSAKGVSLTSA
jgi:dTDP-4-dehydrorhamnose reductase